MTNRHVCIVIDGDSHQVEAGLVYGQQLLQLAKLSDHQQLLLEVPNDLDVPVTTQDAILIRGGESFSIGKGDPPLPDNPCLRHPPHIHFNGKPVTPEHLFHHSKVTGLDIKRLDPNLKDGDKLYADLEGLADELIQDSQRIILQKPDRFITVPCGNVGFNNIATEYLAEVQSVYPDAHFSSVSGVDYLVVPKFSLPENWLASEVTLLCIVPNGFPMSALDMFWVTPSLRLPTGGEPNCANHYEEHLGQQWQRFSWHYTHGTAWKPSQSSLLTHLQFCKSRLNQIM